MPHGPRLAVNLLHPMCSGTCPKRGRPSDHGPRRVKLPFFRMRLILALIVGITLVSVGSTYFDVLAHKLSLRRELVRRSELLGASLQPQVEQAMAAGSDDAIRAAVTGLHRNDQALGLAVFAPNGRLI